jgi:uncharacterized membrane protein
MSSWIMEALLLVIVVVPLVILFGYAVFDVIRRHGIGVGHKAIWLVVFCLVPIVGPLVYLVIRPPGMTAQENALAGDSRSRAAELATLAELHDRGKLTDEEFHHSKAEHIFSGDRSQTSGREQRGGSF